MHRQQYIFSNVSVLVVKKKYFWNNVPEASSSSYPLNYFMDSYISTLCNQRQRDVYTFTLGVMNVY